MKRLPFCVYCGSRENLTTDHVIPLGRWQEVTIRRRVLDNPSNLVTACYSCNQEKANLLPGEWFAKHPEYYRCFLHYARYLSDEVRKVVIAQMLKRRAKGKITVCRPVSSLF